MLYDKCSHSLEHLSINIKLILTLTFDGTLNNIKYRRTQMRCDIFEMSENTKNV